MATVPLEDLLVVQLADGQPGERADDPDGETLSTIAAALSLSPNQLSTQLELVSALESLKDRGLVTTRSVDDGSDDRVLFALADDGEARAPAVRNQLADTSVEVVDDTTRELTLREAAADLDGSMVGIAAQLADDGRYYPQETLDQEFVGRSVALQQSTDAISEVRGAPVGHSC